MRRLLGIVALTAVEVTVGFDEIINTLQEGSCPLECQNHGKCARFFIHTDGLTKSAWRCLCPKGWSGPSCDIPECVDHCLNGGECRWGVCNCAKARDEGGRRVAGTFCQHVETTSCFDEAMSLASKHAGHAHRGFCVNGGSCEIDTVGRTSCNCEATDFNGAHCEFTEAERRLQGDPTASPAPSFSPTESLYPTATIIPTRTWSPTKTSYPTATLRPSITAFPTSSQPIAAGVLTPLPSGTKFPSPSFLNPTFQQPSRPSPTQPFFPPNKGPTAPKPTTSYSDTSLSGGAIFGIVLVVLVALGFIAFWWQGRNRHARTMRRAELRSELELAERDSVPITTRRPYDPNELI